MNLVRKISASVLSVLDFGPEKVSVLMAEKKGGAFRILGGGEAPAAGVSGGAIIHLGDASESVIAAVRAAEGASGAPVDTLFYNLDDLAVEEAVSTGSKTLPGEGEVRPSDVAEACHTAERLVGHFEKNIIYARPLSFLIDDRDPVSDPVGVFGRKLDVSVLILMARAEHCEAWKRLMRRAHVPKAVGVPTAWSCAYGVLAPAERKKTRILADADADFTTVFVYGDNRIRSLRVLPTGAEAPAAAAARVAEQALELASASEGRIEDLLVTGALSMDEEFWGGLKPLEGKLKLERRGPAGVPGLEAPRYASLAGLLSVAEEFDRKKPMLQRQKGLLSSAQEKAVSFLNEYF